MLFAGSVNEQPTNVTVNGVTATINRPTTNFMAYVNVAGGTSTNTIIATDYNNNSATNKYQVIVTNNGVAATLTFDANGNMFERTEVQTDPNMYYAGTGTVTPITDANGNDITSSLLVQVATMPLMAATIGPEREGAKCLEAAAVRTEARNIAEQLAMREAEAGAGTRIMQGAIDDPAFPENVWAKMQWVHTTPDGQNITIHYWQNLQTGERTGFKFKN
jgi:hypothetical protein